MAKESFTDNKRVRDLIKLMTDHGLTEVELVEDKARIRLKRDLPVMGGPAVTAAFPMPIQTGVAGGAAGGAAGAGASAPVENENLVSIKSPMVGTFYTAPNPESDAYVKVGSVVTAKTVVCVIEAMKVFNEIHAEISGNVVKILVQNGQAVEFNQPLFLVEPD